METSEIYEQIIKLPLGERIRIIEMTLKSIREKEQWGKMALAVDELEAEYKSNKELIVFTEIDFENFYETR